MRAIVIEGAKGASEYQLWDQMVQEKCPGLQHYLGLRWGVCPASGNGGILTCLDLLLRLAKHDYTASLTGGKGTAVRPGELDMDAAASIQLNGQ